MTHKPTKPHQSGGKKPVSSADQWIDGNWYLPPGGDQSWRDQEARRIFGDGENSINDKDGPDAARASYDAGFKRPRPANLLLPVSLIACAVVFAGALLLPQILTPAIWGPSEPKARSETLVRFTAPAQAESKLADAGEVKQDKAVSQALPAPIGQAVEAADPSQKTAPLPRPTANDLQDAKPAVRVAKPRRALPPIGANYFARHAPAGEEQVATSLPPIGQAYFESHAPAATDSADISRTE